LPAEKLPTPRVTPAPTLAPLPAAAAAAAAVLDTGGCAAAPPIPPETLVISLTTLLPPQLITPITRTAAALLATMVHAARVGSGRTSPRGAGNAALATRQWVAALLAGGAALSLAAAAMAASFAEAAVPGFGGGWWRCWAAALSIVALARTFSVLEAAPVQAAVAAVLAMLRMRWRRPTLQPPPSAPPAAVAAAAADASGAPFPPAAASAAGVGAAPSAALPGPQAAGSGPRCLLVSTALFPAPPAAAPAHIGGAAGDEARTPAAGIDLGMLQQLLRQHQRGAAGSARPTRPTQEAAARSSLYVSPLRHVFVGAKVRGLRPRSERQMWFTEPARTWGVVEMCGCSFALVQAACG
jgi:hypothetical protein